MNILRHFSLVSRREANFSTRKHGEKAAGELSCVFSCGDFFHESKLGESEALWPCVSTSTRNFFPCFFLSVFILIFFFFRFRTSLLVHRFSSRLKKEEI